MNQPDAPAPPPVLPPIITTPPSPLAPQPSSGRKFIALLLSLFLGLFLVTGIVSLLDDSCVLFWGNHSFTTISGIISFVTFLTAVFVYGLMGLTPAVPKRLVLPMVLLIGAIMLGTLPVMIYFYRRLQLFDLLASCITVALGLGLVVWLQGGGKFRWPFVGDRYLGTRPFSWRHLSLFLLLNLLVVLPVVAASVAGCAGLAVSHFTEGFVSLRPGGLVMQARKYTREDGKTILLFPMSHIADADFYRNVIGSIASNSVILLEGISDTNHLLTNGLSYKHAASSLHLSEQHEDFKFKKGKWFELVHADVDVQAFSTNTIGLLNLVASVYSEGLNPHTLSLLLNCTPPPDVEQQLFDDILLKRNEHLLGELQARLPKADQFVIPWGAVHMAGISQAIEKSGFRLVESRDFVAIRFGSPKSGPAAAGPPQPGSEP